MKINEEEPWNNPQGIRSGGSRYVTAYRNGGGDHHPKPTMSGRPSPAGRGSLPTKKNARGELSMAGIVAMRTLYASDPTILQADLAEWFGVSKHTVWRIVRGVAHLDAGGPIVGDSGRHLRGRDPEFVKAVLRMRRMGAHSGRIAKTLRTGTTQVMRTLRKHAPDLVNHPSIRRRRRNARPDASMVLEGAELRRQGWTLRQIADKFDCNYRAMRDAIVAQWPELHHIGLEHPNLEAANARKTEEASSRKR